MCVRPDIAGFHTSACFAEAEARLFPMTASINGSKKSAPNRANTVGGSRLSSTPCCLCHRCSTWMTACSSAVVVLAADFPFAAVHFGASGYCINHCMKPCASSTYGRCQVSQHADLCPSIMLKPVLECVSGRESSCFALRGPESKRCREIWSHSAVGRPTNIALVTTAHPTKNYFQYGSSSNAACSHTFGKLGAQ